MMILVTGGSGSGKSAYGEKRIEELSESNRIYIATMIPWDGECQEKIRRHRRAREKKKFLTIEQYRDVENVELPSESTVLLECMSNLTANEMFREDRQKPFEEEEIIEKIIKGVAALKERSKHLVAVTNEVFSDGCLYSRETESYCRILGRINCRLAAMADEVTEVLWGIPIKIK